MNKDFYKIRNVGYRCSKRVLDKDDKSVLATTNFCEPSSLDAFMFEEVKSPHGKYPSITITSDIYMLFNQKRLDKMTLESLVEHFQNAPQSDTALNKLRSKLSDEELAQFVKSRYIQSRSELLSWSNYLTESYDVAKIDAALGGVPAGEPAPAPAPTPTDE